MSSEKYELAQDELDTLLEKIESDLVKTESSNGEAKKRMVQVEKNRHEKKLSHESNPWC